MKLAIYLSKPMSNILLIVNNENQYGIIDKQAKFITANFEPFTGWNGPVEIL